MLARGGLFGLIAIFLVLFAGTGLVGRTLPPVVAVFPMLPCNGPCFSRKLDIMPSCTCVVLELWWVVQVVLVLKRPS